MLAFLHAYSALWIYFLLFSLRFPGAFYAWTARPYLSACREHTDGALAFHHD